MKKSIAIAIAALAAGSIFAQTTVSSANIVGYVKPTTPPAGTYKILSLTMFSDGDDSINIQDVIENLDELNAAQAGLTAKEEADKLHVWTGSGYKTYGLFQPSSSSNFWAELTEPGWVSEFLSISPATNELQRGISIWYETGVGGTPTNTLISGDVYLDDTFNINVSSYSLISYPYSANVSLTDLVVSNALAATAGPTAKDNADKIHLWNGVGYTAVGLFQPSEGDAFWAELTEPGWVSGFLSIEAATNVIDLGSGFWYESANGPKTIGFSRNYLLEE